jgi:hypothetical protein
MNVSDQSALHGSWDRRSQRLEKSRYPLPTGENDALHEFLLQVTGRYLSGVVQPDQQLVEFPYVVRAQATGFLKLDVAMEILVVGCDCRSGPVGQFLTVVDKAHYLASMSAHSSGMVSFVPIIAFGQHDSYLFYIESLRGLGQLDPFFVDASHQFIAHQLLPRYANSLGIPAYLDRLRASRS